MKRTGYIRHRSKNNSRNHENSELREEYRAANPLCELRLYFTELSRFPKNGEEINHLFSVRKRYDILSNLIHLSAEAHRWFHANSIDGRIACLYVKFVKHELDDAEIKTASGKHIAGILAAKTPTLSWLEPCYRILCEAFP